MPVADYRCRECGKIIERVLDNLPTTIDSYCDETGTDARMDRIWSPFHTSTGSNGERPK